MTGIIMLRRSGLILLLLFFFMALTLLVYRNFMDISTGYEETAPLPAPPSATGARDTVHVGVISRFSPNLIYDGYQPIMDYLTRETGILFALKLSSSYEETIAQLDQGEIQSAFLGTYLYLEARRNHPIRCILKPLNSHLQPYFHSMVITRDDSPIRSIADLAGKRLALPSPLSFSGNWLLGYELQRHGLTASDLDSIHYFGFHHTVVYQVLLGRFDAGVVKDRVAAEFTSKGIRVIAVSREIPGSPIIIRRDMAPRISEAMINALLRIDASRPEHRDLIKDWDPEFAWGFARAQESDYDQVDAIFAALKERPR